MQVKHYQAVEYSIALYVGYWKPLTLTPRSMPLESGIINSSHLLGKYKKTRGMAPILTHDAIKINDTSVKREI